MEKPKFHMGNKIDFDDTKKYIHSLPGPGTHEPAAQTIKQRSPIYSMGARLMALKNTTAIVPGQDGRAAAGRNSVQSWD